MSLGEQEESPRVGFASSPPRALCAGGAQPVVQGCVEAAELWTSLPPPTFPVLSAALPELGRAGTAPHSLPAAQDLEEVVPNWAGASAVTWDADFEKRRLVHVMQPLQSSWWGFLPLIPKYSPFSTAEAQGSGSFPVRLTYPEPVFGGLPLLHSLPLPCAVTLGAPTLAPWWRCFGHIQTSRLRSPATLGVSWVMQPCCSIRS